MRVAVTGGVGFIGAHLLARLVGAGLGVTLVGPHTGHSRYVDALVASGAVRFARCDSHFRDEHALRSALEDVEALVLLGYAKPSEVSASERLSKEIDDNVAPTIRLLRATEGRAHHVVFASSASVYGAALRTPIAENEAPSPLTSLGVAKLMCEHAVRVWCIGAGATATILRYSTVYGPGEVATRMIPSFIRAALAGKPLVVEGDGTGEVDYIHVADAADATFNALRNQADGLYNIGTGIGVTAIELAQLVVWLTGSRLAPVRGQSSGGQRDRTSLVLDASRARAELGLVTRRTLADGLTEEIGWVKAQLASTLRPAA